MTMQLSASTAARVRVDRIKTGVEVIWTLIVESYQARDWEALGYASWDELCTREFGTSRLRLPREERSETIGSLRDAGLSLRAISAATGHDVKTIRADLAEVREIPTPEEAERPLTQAECEALDARPQEVVEQPAEPKTVTGLDGKNYSAAKPSRSPNRKPLTDEFRTASLDIGRVTDRIGRLSQDDRFNKNADQISQFYLHDLIRARDALQCVIDQLSTQKG